MSVPSPPVFSIAPRASTVHLHLHQYSESRPDNQQDADSTPMTRFDRYYRPSPLQRQSESQAPPQNRHTAMNSDIQTSNNSTTQRTSTDNRQNQTRILSEMFRIVPSSEPETNRRPRPTHLESPSVVQRLASQSTTLQDMLQRIRQQGRDDGYSVSFEFGTNDEPSSNIRGLSLTELSRYTTTSLFCDLQDGDDENLESKENDDEAPETCSICQEQLTPHSIIRKIERCNHIFHQECIEKWLSEHATCPLCMQNVSEEEDESQRTNESLNNERERLNEVHQQMFRAVASELGI